jgi:hypothetical protein
MISNSTALCASMCMEHLMLGVFSMAFVVWRNFGLALLQRDCCI